MFSLCVLQFVLWKKIFVFYYPGLYKQQRMVAVIYKNSDSHRLTEDIHLMI